MPSPYWVPGLKYSKSSVFFKHILNAVLSKQDFQVCNVIFSRMVKLLEHSINWYDKVKRWGKQTQTTVMNYYPTASMIGKLNKITTQAEYK